MKAQNSERVDRVYFTIRLDRDLREKLHELGKANYRSASREAEIAIRAHLQRETGEPSPGHSVKA